MSVGLFIYLALLLVCFVKPKSKIATISMLFFLWIIFAFCTYSGDFVNYNNAYNRLAEGKDYNGFEPLYTYLMKAGIKAGFSFIMFRTLLATIYLGIIGLLLNNTTKYTALVLALYSLCPFFYFSSVLRSGLASLFVLLAYYSLAKFKKKGYIFFFLFSAIAVLFHYSTILFFALICVQNTIKVEKYAIFGISLIFIVNFAFREEILSDIVSKVIDSKKYSRWLTPDKIDMGLSWKGQLSQVIILLGNFAITYFVYIRKKQNRFLSGFFNESNTLEMMPAKVNLLTFACIPFLMLSDVYMRYIWTIQLIDYVYWVNSFSNYPIAELNIPIPKKNRSVKINIGIILTIVWAFILCVYIEKPYWGTENSILKLFTNNLIFQNF